MAPAARCRFKRQILSCEQGWVIPIEGQASNRLRLAAASSAEDVAAAWSAIIPGTAYSVFFQPQTKQRIRCVTLLIQPHHEKKQPASAEHRHLELNPRR